MARRKPQVCKVDQNHAQIVEELRGMGLSVTSLAKVARGAPDIVVGVEGLNLLFEIKRPRNKKGEPEALTEDEAKWHQTWKGHVQVVTTTREAALGIEDQLNLHGLRTPPGVMAFLVL